MAVAVVAVEEVVAVNVSAGVLALIGCVNNY